MKRRDFSKVLSGSAIGTVAAYGEPVYGAPAKLKPQKNLKMHVACGGGRDEKGLTFLERLGVKYLASSGWPTETEEKYPDNLFAKLSLDKILRLNDECAKHNIIYDGLSSSNMIFIWTIVAPDKGDKMLDVLCDNIRIASKAGIRFITTSLKEAPNSKTGQGFGETVKRNYLGVGEPRGEGAIGRGGNRYITHDVKELLAKYPHNFYDFTISADQNWAAITHFLERVIPVATEYKVQIACHPCDPWLPPGFRGVDRVLHDFEGFKRYIEICPSPYHGLLFCLGCFAESCDDPGTEVYPIVQYFAERNKIFEFHYRNIIGGRNHFTEVYPDEGVVNMHRVMQILRDTQYPWGIDYDHTAAHKDDPGRRQSAAYQIGYIQAMIQAVNDEV